MMRNKIISELFEQMADVMEIIGEDKFRINSYRAVARVIGDLTEDVEVLLTDGRLAELPGIGKSSLAKIEEFVKTGSIDAYRQLLEKVPATVLELLKIPGIGPKGVKTIYDNLKVTTVEQLQKAIKSGKVAELPGFGHKKAEAIARGIKFLASATGRIRLDEAFAAAEVVIDFLSKLSIVKRIGAAGSLRRMAETVGDVDILASSAGAPLAWARNGKKIIDAFTGADFIDEVLATGDTKGAAVIKVAKKAVHVDVRVVPEESFGAAAQYFTGSKQHNIKLREIAAKKRLKLNEYGLFDARERMIAGDREAEIYRRLGLDCIEPILREDRGEIEAAKEHTLPKVVRLKDIKGDFHVHTNASDGSCDIEQMAQRAMELGYEFICITDHSVSAAIAHGLSAKRLAGHIKKIRKIAEKSKRIKIFAGAEVDILANGSLDYDDKVLADLDFVTVSIHSGLGGPRERVTTRTLKAMDNRYVHCIAHPTGRLIGQREAMDIDMAAVIRHAAQTQTLLEVNANPMRLDLKDVHCRMAIEAGVKLAIGTDAHNEAGMDQMIYGVATAGRGWASSGDVLNTYSAKKIQGLLHRKRK